MVTALEKLPWLQQTSGSVDCGAVAILNARLWQGEQVGSGDIEPLVQALGISASKDGVSGSDLDRWIRLKRHFGVTRLVQPSWQAVASYLSDGQGVILRYRWEVDGRSGAHFVFLVSNPDGRILIANPHRRSRSEARDKWRYLSLEALQVLCQKATVGRRIYPWIWVIPRAE